MPHRSEKERKTIKSIVKEYGTALLILGSVVGVMALATYAMNADLPVLSPILKAMFCRTDLEGIVTCFDKEP